MPVDSRGRPVSKGDRVTLTLDVLDVYSDEDGMNLRLVAVNSTGASEYTPLVSCNSRLVTVQAVDDGNEPGHSISGIDAETA